MAQPFALRVFVPSGIPEGLRIVEKSNWSGIGFVVPRSQLAEFLARPEAQRPGVYVLLGPEPDGSGELAYIGEADPLGRRLEPHAASGDFWTTAFAFTDKDSHLNKAHGLHLEARLIELARIARRCKLDNLQQGRSILLSEVDRPRPRAISANCCSAVRCSACACLNAPWRLPSPQPLLQRQGLRRRQLCSICGGRMPMGRATNPPAASRCWRAPERGLRLWIPAPTPSWPYASSSPSRACSWPMARA